MQISSPNFLGRLLASQTEQNDTFCIMCFGLFLTSLVAATIIPFSSEAALVGALAFGADPITCLIVASAGNCTGASLNYIAGLKGIRWVLQRIFRFDQERLERFEERYRKQTILFLLGSWLPVVGDPITAYLGVVRCPFWKFAIFVFGTRTLRYVAIYALYALST